MFYLIDEKDGLLDKKFLVNINTLLFLETSTSKSDSVELAFHFLNKEDLRFPYKKDNCLNVNALIKTLSEIPEVQYKNKHICLTDVDNFDSLKREQFYLHKFSDVLVHLESILFAYLKDGSTFILTEYYNFKVKESPEEIFAIIQNKIL